MVNSWGGTARGATKSGVSIGPDNKKPLFFLKGVDPKIKGGGTRTPREIEESLKKKDQFRGRNLRKL